MNRPPFDPAELIERAADDVGLARELIAVYQEDRADLVNTVRTHVEVPDQRSRAAHRLKGALLALAAGPAAQLALDLEQLEATAPTPMAHGLLKRLEKELERLDEALAQPLPGE